MLQPQQYTIHDTNIGSRAIFASTKEKKTMAPQRELDTRAENSSNARGQGYVPKNLEDTHFPKQSVIRE